MRVPTSVRTRHGLLRSRSRYYQYSKLVVIVRYENGRWEGRLVDIPDLRTSRKVAVEFP